MLSSQKEWEEISLVIGRCCFVVKLPVELWQFGNHGKASMRTQLIAEDGREEKG